MNNPSLILPPNWQDWVTVFGYVGFTVFVFACILVAQNK